MIKSLPNPTEQKHSEFITWFRAFISHKGGWYPHHLIHWLKRIDQNHREIREVIGGEKIIKTYVLEATQNAADEQEIKTIVDQIVGLIPNYLYTYNFDKSVFRIPTIPQGSHQAIKLGKHVRTYAYKILHQENMTRLDKLLSELGGIHARYRTNKTELQITLSTSPDAFVNLGHYGPDAESCFKQGGGHNNNKYAIAQTKNSFVIVISKPGIGNVARCFGFYNHHLRSFNIFNYYFSPGTQEGDTIEVFKRLFSEILGCPVVFSEDKNGLNGVYQNPYGRWSFSEKEIAGTIIAAEVKNIIVYMCSACGREDGNDKNWADVDGHLLCAYCIKNANTCELTGSKTMKILAEVVMKDGDLLKVHPEIAITADVCKCGHRCEELQKVNEDSVCALCAIEYGECDECGKMHKDHELFNLNGEEICSVCLEADRHSVLIEQ